MLSGLPCNYKGLWSWRLSRKRMCQLIWVWIQQSITHQQWESPNTSRQSSVNRSTSFHNDTHLTSKHSYTLSHAQKPRYTLPHIPRHVPSSNTHTKLLYAHRRYTNVQTGVRCEIPEFSKCLTAHNRGAKTTSGHMIWENRLILEGVYQGNPNTTKCVSAKFTWSSELSSPHYS